MSSHELRLDRTLYSDDVISRTAHRYSNDFFIEIQVENGATIIRLTSKNDVGDQSLIPERFQNDALDERLREIVRKETSELQMILVKAALNESLSRRDSASV